MTLSSYFFLLFYAIFILGRGRTIPEQVKILEKMYETLLTNEECSRAFDLGNFYRVPADQRDLNYDKYFKEGSVERAKLTEFNSNNTTILDVEQVKEKLLSLKYIRDEIREWESK